MRYALTYMPTGGGFVTTDTIIVEVNKTKDESYIFGDNPQDIVKALVNSASCEEVEAEEIAREKLYYLRNVDDVDTYLEV